MRKVVISFTDTSLKNAGSKAVIDINSILSKAGFEVWNIQADFNSKFSKLNYLLTKLHRKFNLKTLANVEEVVIQYPLSSILNKIIINKIRKYSNAKIILIIHDLEALRVERGNSSKSAKEIELLNDCDGLVVHNISMKNWLIKEKINKPMSIIGLFDYLNPQPINNSFEYKGTICFAGNIDKSKFLKKINLTNHKLELFGVTKTKDFQNSIIYKGSYLPDQLPKHLTQNFGLVWDGNSTFTCDGIYGEYMRFNNPHKTSLYISSGIPVIIWDKAALAPVIKKYHIGLTVKSLDSLDEILDNVSQEEYKKMKQNTVQLAQKLREGVNTIDSINKLEGILNLKVKK